MRLDPAELARLEERRGALEAELRSPDLARNQRAYSAAARRLADLSRLIEVWRSLAKAEEELEWSKGLLDDPSPDMRRLAQSEIEELGAERARLEAELKILLLPSDPNDERDTIVEIRAATGGDEAALFAAVLFRMYSRYAESQRWRVELLSTTATGEGGFKEVCFSIEGDGVYSRLKYESGVHRVQRIPATEAQGRVHTSTVTVAVLPEAEEVEVEIRPEDLRVNVFRSSGPGGQSVNTTDSAVRVTHLPTGLVVTCQDEKSQLMNKQKALKVLRARLMDQISAERDQRISSERRGQVGTGERNERIRTYNYLQNRLTDHRVGLTVYRLQDVLDGDLSEIVGEISAHFQARLLASSGAGD
jgi:peptide chain release factor 1